MTNAPLIDSHTHLDFNHFDADRKDVILRAQENNVLALISIGIDIQTSRAALKIAQEYDNIFTSAGFHPHDANKMTSDDFDELEQLYSHPKVVAIGEVGLDYFYDYSPREIQRRVFRRFIDLAIEIRKPLIIHTREANEDVLSILKDRAKSGWNGVFHCFSGDENMARKVLDLGFYISFTGNVTFKNSRSLPVAKYVPTERMIVETDCPFLTPVPFRGKRNEPAFVNYVARKIAENKNMPFDEFAIMTTRNAKNLFQLPLKLVNS